MNLIISGLILSIVILSLIIRQWKLYKKLKQLRHDWGKIPENALDIESVKTFFEFNKVNSIDHSYCVDEDTWHDLDFNEIFSLINRTTTPIGAQYLFYLLRHPVFKREILYKREELINNFSKDQNLREKVQITIQSLEEKNAKYLPYSLWKPLPEKPVYAKFLPFLSFLSLSILLLVLFDFLHFSVLIVIFIINLIIRSFVKRKIDVFIYSFQYLGVLIRTAEKISSLKFNELKDIQKILIKNLRETKIIAKKIFALQFKDDLGLIEYLNIYFLWDISGFYSAIDEIEQHIDKLRKIYETVGYLDTLISIASFRLDYHQSCRPSFNRNFNKYIVNAIYNPLLNNPVPNSFDFDTKNFIITGSNMSGKTTFLKTIGVNAILAQTINTSMAERYEAPLIKVISSIGMADNLILGKSYYLSEVESILRLLKASNSDIIHLFILDEIFRGTNSVERLASSIEVLNYLANEKDFILVATHDLQLSRILNHKYQNFHFREKVCEEGLSFDYKLHPGTSTTRNAIALLKYVGYPKSIVENASNRINNNGI